MIRIHHSATKDFALSLQNSLEKSVASKQSAEEAAIEILFLGLGASAKLGIIVGVLVVAIAMVLFSLIKMKVISNTRRFKLNQVNRKNEKNFTKLKKDFKN